MAKLILILVAALVLAIPATASAATAGAPYRSDAQAARYLERLAPGSAAYCLNGYYSRYEQRTGRHQRQLAGRERFRSFACVWTTDRGTRHVYVQTRRHGRWMIRRDR